jgi:hypothetical protein
MRSLLRGVSGVARWRGFPAATVRCSSASPLALQDRVEFLQERLRDEQRRQPTPGPTALQSGPAKEGALQDTGAAADKSECHVPADAPSALKELIRHAKQRNAQGAVSVVRRMHRQGLQPSAELFEQAMRACLRAGDLPRMWALLELMDAAEAGGGSTEVFLKALELCKNAGDAEGGLRVYARMRASGLWPGNAGLSHLLPMLSRDKQWQRARNLLQEIADAGEPTRLKHWNSLVAACGETRGIRTGSEPTHLNPP